jgi:hypothetical protein
MTPDAFSDLVLALTCAVLAHRCRGDGRGGVAVACLLIGIAALLGMLRFSSWEPLATAVGGAHRFASLVAAVAGFPLLAFSLASPGGALARHAGGAWWLAFAVGGFGVAAWLLGFKVWAQLAPLASVAAIAWAVQRHGAGGRRWAGFAGVLLPVSRSPPAPGRRAARCLRCCRRPKRSTTRWRARCGWSWVAYGPDRSTAHRQKTASIQRVASTAA